MFWVWVTVSVLGSVAVLYFGVVALAAVALHWVLKEAEKGEVEE